MIKLPLPTYLGGNEVELETDGISSNEQVIGWIDEYGTIVSSKVNVVIGYLVSTEDGEYSALIIDTGEFRKHLT
jgi:hypothetical protein